MTAKTPTTQTTCTTTGKTTGKTRKVTKKRPAGAAGTRRPVPAHLSSKSDDWPTPMSFYSMLDAEFGFVLDVCASTKNHKAPAYYALDHADPDRRDGLAADWAAECRKLGGPAFANVPYGRGIGAWMAKAVAAARAGATVVALVPVRADTAWFHDHVLWAGAEIRLVRGRLTFGDAIHTAAFASAVIIFRPTDIPDVPGPLSIMPNKPPAPATAAVAAAGPRTTPAWPAQLPVLAGGVTHWALSIDCICCQVETSEVIEHTFDCEANFNHSYYVSDRGARHV